MPNGPIDPLIPTGLDVVFAIITVVATVLAVIALITLLRDRAVTSSAEILWTAVIVFVPLLGAVVWLQVRVSPRR